MALWWSAARGTVRLRRREYLLGGFGELAVAAGALVRLFTVGQFGAIAYACRFRNTRTPRRADPTASTGTSHVMGFQ